MSTATRKCKVCGKEYEYCHTIRRVPNVFRWQDVACCVDHGSAYLAQIIASRSKKNNSDGDSLYDVEPDTSHRKFDELDESEGDELFSEDFDDSAEEPEIEI